MKKYCAEAIATAILVLVGVGGATFVARTPMQVALCFALSVFLLASTVGNISGGHANTSITLGHFFSGKLSLNDTIGYVIGQIVGALVAGFILYLISGQQADVLATNQVAEGYSVIQAGLVEIVTTFIFVFVILRVTSQEKLENVAGIIIGITLGLLVAVSVPVTNGSLNFARSLSVAIYSSDALANLWIFLVFPTIGGILAGLLNKFMFMKDGE